MSFTEIEGRRKEFERCGEWDPGETTKEQLGQPKGQERLLCLAGVDGLDEVLSVALPEIPKLLVLAPRCQVPEWEPCPRHRSKARTCCPVSVL